MKPALGGCYWGVCVLAGAENTTTEPSREENPDTVDHRDGSKTEQDREGCAGGLSPTPQGEEDAASSLVRFQACFAF